LFQIRNFLRPTSYINQNVFARPSAGHPRAARGCAAGLDLRRLIQLLVGISLALAPLAPKADRTGSTASTDDGKPKKRLAVVCLQT
jgi:hypothetical protein